MWLRDRVGHPRQRQIADRHHVCVGVAGAGVAAAIAEGVELLDITQCQAGLLLHPGAQADLEGAVRDGIEWSERQPGEAIAVAARRRQHQRLVGVDGNDRGGEADLDGPEQLVGHRASHPNQIGR